MAMATDLPSTFTEKSCIKMVGYDMTRKAAQEVFPTMSHQRSGTAPLTARKVYRKAGVEPKDVQVIELHDCFSANELITYEALGLCPEGQAGKLIDQGQVTYGGKWACVSLIHPSPPSPAFPCPPSHLRVAGGESVWRADLEGSPAGRHGPCTVR